MFMFIIILFVLLDIIALRWGADSRDTFNSPEWKRYKEFWS